MNNKTMIVSDTIRAKILTLKIKLNLKSADEVIRYLLSVYSHSKQSLP